MVVGSGLACFHLRDSCVLVRVCCARAHGVDFKKSPGPGRTTRPGPGFCIVWNTVNKQEADNMEWSFVFFLNSALLGVGLAMDAFSVSMANGLHDPKMGKGTMCRIAGTFGVFQAVILREKRRHQFQTQYLDSLYSPRHNHRCGQRAVRQISHVAWLRPNDRTSMVLLLSNGDDDRYSLCIMVSQT